MTTMIAPVMDTVAPVQPRQAPPLLLLIPASMLVFLWPRLSRSWPRVTLLRAALVATFNVLCGFLWTALIFLAAIIWEQETAYKTLAMLQLKEPIYYTAFRSLRGHCINLWAQSAFLDRLAFFSGIVCLLLAVFLLPFFVILPFGARPGPNKPCLRHVARTVLLGSGAIHWWGAAFVAIFLTYGHWRVAGFLEDYAQALTPLLLAFTGLSVWTLVILGLAVRREYRTPADYPQPHDPWCDDCGYTLTGIDPNGRCPECGRLISDSLGPQNRPPTAWENHPSLFQFRIIARQLLTLIRHPRTLFFSMPTRTGQGAAQRWLLASAVILFLLALPIVPALYIVFDAPWNVALIASSLAMALSWTVFGLMMVGVETAGIATFSRLRGQGQVYLATSAKVTAYSAFLMIPWIILGGTQLIAYAYLSEIHAFRNVLHLGVRGEQVALVLSLSAAHIGGLMWYELTVYRGIRAIQYANK